MIELAPATLDMIARGRGGKLVLIENDVNGIAQQLHELTSHLRFPLKLRYSEEGQYFAVYQVLENGRDEHLVTTAQHCDQRLIERIRKVIHPSYDPGAEADAVEAQADRNKDSKFNEQVGEISEKLSHALRTDIRTGAPGPVYIPPDILPSRPVFIKKGLKNGND